MVPGGGEAEIWQELKCKEKYAGEVRLEFTYYDSRPKFEKSVPKKQNSKVFEDGQSPSGSFSGRLPVKRRPLPTNPGSIERPRSSASGPRDIGSQSHSKSADMIRGTRQRSANNNNIPQPVQQRGQPQLSGPHHDHQKEPDPFTQHEHESQHENQGYNSRNGPDVGSDWHQSVHRRDAPEDHKQPYPNYQNNNNFLPQLPPMSRSRGGDSRRNSRVQHEYDRATRNASHDDVGSALALLNSDHQMDLRNDWHPQEHRQISDPYQQNHGVSWNQRQEGSQVRATSEGSSNHHFTQSRGQEDEYHGGEPIQYQQSAMYDVPADQPPPPPMHRALPSTETTRSYQSLPAQEFDEPSWPRNHDGNNDSFPNSSREPQSRSRSHFTSRSEVSLARYGETFDDVTDLHHPRSANGSYGRQLSDTALQRHRGFSEEPVSTYQYHDLPSPRSLHYDNSQPSQTRPNIPHTPRSAGSFSHDQYNGSPALRRDSYQSASPTEANARLARHQPHHTQTYPPPGQHPPLATSSSYPLLHSRNGSVTPSISPTRPHPLSQEHNILSSSPHDDSPEERALHASTYNQAMPVIRPLAIAPRKSQPTTPSSVDRHGRSQSRSTIPRKSVSPHPISADGKSHFSAYSPDSFNVLNPESSPTAQRNLEPDGPIVDFHGNVIDPSDRLPEHSWAPEPATTAKAYKDDALPPSSWAPEPMTTSHRNSEPRKITVRTRENVRGARSSHGGSPSMAINVSCKARPPPEHRSSMFVSSPSPLESPTAISPGTSPHVRNRLRKLNRPHSMATMSSSAPSSSHGQDTWTPPIPDKVPMDHGGSMVPYGQAMDRLSYEMQSIDIGGGAASNPDARRIGGRRLLGYGA